MNLWNFLKPNKNNNVEFKPLVRDPLANDRGLRTDGSFAQGVPFEALQVDSEGNVSKNTNWQPEKEITINDRVKDRVNGFGQRVYENLMGKQARPTDNITQGGETITTDDGVTYKPIGDVTTSVNPRTGGIFRDITSGYNENRFTPASLENFGQNTLPDGRNKGFAYRFGEGLGSLGRVVDSPFGRGLLTAGLIGTIGGGSVLEALAYGSTAGMLNQGNRMRDRVYRDDLIATAQQSLKEQPDFNKLSAEDQQAQLDNIANQVNAYRGYVDNNTYNNMIRAQQIRDNAAYRKMYFDTNQANIQAQREWQKQLAEQQRADRQAEFDYRKYNDAQNRALQKRGQDLNYALGKDKIEGNNKIDKSVQKSISENMQTLADINAGLQLLEENPNAYSWVKGVLGADITNRIDPKGIKTRTAIDNITAVYRKWLTGAQMSDAERKAYERFLPAPTDNYKTVKAKLEGMRDSIQRKNDVVIGNYSVNNDPLGIL